MWMTWKLQDVFGIGQGLAVTAPKDESSVTAAQRQEYFSSEHSPPLSVTDLPQC